MKQFDTESQKIDRILSSFTNVAVVGMSNNILKDSYRVAMYLKDKGYKIVPVNPNHTEIAGMTCYPKLSQIPSSIPIEIVNIFRRSKDVAPIVDEAINCKAKVVWMQKGIVDVVASRKAESAGIDVIMDRCILVEVRARVKR